MLDVRKERREWFLGTEMLGKSEPDTEFGRGSDCLGRKGSSWGNKKK